MRRQEQRINAKIKEDPNLAHDEWFLKGAKIVEAQKALLITIVNEMTALINQDKNNETKEDNSGKSTVSQSGKVAGREKDSAETVEMPKPRSPED